MEVKDRKRYELGNFRGVDTASTPSEVSPKRATYMRNIENRDGLNHKRFGWKEEMSQKVSSEDVTIYDFFTAKINSIEYDFIHYDSTLAIYSNEALIATKTNIKEKEGFAYYSNQKVYYFGVGEPLCIYNKNGEIVIESLVDNKDLTYIPTIRTNIGYYGKENDLQEVLDDYNILTHYVKYKFEGVSEKSVNVKYQLPIKGKRISRDFSLIVETKSEEKVLRLGERTQAAVYEEPETERDLRQGLYVSYPYGTSFKTVDMKIQAVNVTTTDSSTYEFFTNGLNLVENPMFSFSNGYYLGYTLNAEEGVIEVRFCNKEGVPSDEVIAKIKINEYAKSVTFYAEEKQITLPADFSLESVSCTRATRMNWAKNFIITGKFPRLQTPSVYELIYLSATIVGSISLEGGWFILNQDFDFAPPIANSSNITLTTYDETFNPKYDLRNINLSVLFGADGRCDRVFASLFENPDIILWSEFNENTYIENPFTYWQESAWTSIGASQNEVNGMTRLNDSTLAIFREKGINDTNFSILTATYVSSNKFEINNETYDIPVLKVSIASANMPQTATNNNCFGALAGSVLFASENGVYAIQISTGTSVERYAVERSEPISNLFANLDMKNAKAIVYKNKYYLAVKTKDGAEDLVLVADARFSYKLDRTMSDTYNYEWYIWDNCPVQKWFIDDDKLGFYDYAGRKCVFTENNFEDVLYNKLNYEITTSTTFPKAYVVDSGLVGKTFYVKKGLKYADTGEDVPNPLDYAFVFPQELSPLYLVNESTANHNFKIDTTEEEIIDKIAKSVNAIWISPSLDLGASDWRKTIFTMTLGIDQSITGTIKYGYQTKDNPNVVNRDTIGANSFSAESYNLQSISFGQNFNFSVTSKNKVRDFTYIQFIFKSDEANDMAVNNLTILYKYNKLNKGAR